MEQQYLIFGYNCGGGVMFYKLSPNENDALATLRNFGVVGKPRVGRLGEKTYVVGTKTLNTKKFTDAFILFYPESFGEAKGEDPEPKLCHPRIVAIPAIFGTEPAIIWNRVRLAE